MKGEAMHDIFVQIYDTPKALIAKLGEATKDTPDLKVLPDAPK
jgi:hypothetical protein